ncbi:hypothetical protein PMF13cell1_00468 [Blautia producta]|jgi:hypothetical protein|uniref:Uncharacterized protein n=1 Tax=Blautia producta TaxID=33035 RepID=A0A4P6LSS0_9FIRM|nr:hypothetical protein PMF13cell1_00468 [Blautia producta]
MEDTLMKLKGISSILESLLDHDSSQIIWNDYAHAVLNNTVVKCIEELEA